ncbi:hypothetical protein BLA24_06225 [Streptomyces cinnamoneus]|uniref:Uncharacterized protein n=1 Tax=Streptomyces cinnamoneus TaxID=53446 RepID=A0A2G1XN27_STRCJ|nr:hypothetical protein BLA24_06225 [Streptomyces cinnamoneus]
MRSWSSAGNPARAMTTLFASGRAYACTRSTGGSAGTSSARRPAISSIRGSRSRAPFAEKYGTTGLRSRSCAGDPSKPMLGAVNVLVLARTSRTSGG